MVRHPIALVLAGLVALPSLAAGQSLAELAAREREKKKGKPTTKVITEDELRRAGSGRGGVATEPAVAASPSASPSPGVPAAAGTQKPKTEEELRAEQEQAWRDKLKQAQGDVDRFTKALDAVNVQLADMSGNLYGGARTTLLTQAEKLKADQQAAQQQVAALQEEGRRSRFRP